LKTAELLLKNKKTLAVAESLTGGLLASAFVDVPGISAAFLCGVVAYSNESKTALLGVPFELIEKHGAVSAEVAGAMALGCKKISGADYALSTTGIAGPEGGSAQKPVGLVYIALAGPGDCSENIVCKKLLLQGSRQDIRKQTVRAACDLLGEALEL